MVRRHFYIQVKLNGRTFKEVQIDPHFEKRHKGSINDFIILALVKSLDGSDHVPESISDSGFEYYKMDSIYCDGKPYRMIWLLHPNETYIGIINCFRRSR